MKKFVVLLFLVFMGLISLADSGIYFNIYEDTLSKSKFQTQGANDEEIEQATALQFKYAIMLGVTVESLNNIELLNFIEKWYGVRYLYGGTSMKGVDCSAFTQILLKEVYGITTDRIVGDQYNKCEKISRNQLQLGDLLFFRHQNKNYLTHVAFYLGNNKFVHASVNKGITIDDLNSQYYHEIYRFAGRPKK